MADTVKQIIEAAQSQTATYLGASAQKLRHIFEVQKNDARNGAGAYAVRPLSAQDFATVTNSYALNHLFQLILTDGGARNQDDEEKLTVLKTLYDSADEIFKVMAKTKLGGLANVIDVFKPVFEEPEFLKNNLIVLRMNFQVRYRHLL